MTEEKPTCTECGGPLCEYGCGCHNPKCEEFVPCQVENAWGTDVAVI